jgi:hypothetical protein
MFRALFGLALAAISSAAVASWQLSTAERNAKSDSQRRRSAALDGARSFRRSAITRPNIGFRSRAQL